MRANFSEKVDKYILSKSLSPLMEEAMSTIKDENIINDMLSMNDIEVPELSNVNTSVYLQSDRHNYNKLGDSTELLAVKYSQNATPEQIEKYKEFLKEYNKAWVAKMKYLVSVELINIFGSIGQVGVSGLYQLRHDMQQSRTYGAKLYRIVCGMKYLVSVELINIFGSIGQVGVSGLYQLRHDMQQSRTYGAKLYRIVCGFNYYYPDDKMVDILDLDNYIDESKDDGDVTVTPISLDSIIDAIGLSHSQSVEGMYYQLGDEDAYHDIEPCVDGVDAPLLIARLLDIISDSIIFGNNFNVKAKENIKDALNRVNKFMITLPLATKMTEMEVMNVITSRLLDSCKRIPDTGLCDSYDTKLVGECKDIDPELLAQDIINYAKHAAKYFKDIYDSDKPGELFPAVQLTESGDIKKLSGISASNFSVSYFNIAAKYFKDIYDSDKPGELFPAVQLTESGDIKKLSGISASNFSVSYFNINKLGLDSYVAD